MNRAQKDNSGVLFKNREKEQDRHPDYTGEAMVNGQPMRMAAWIKTSSKGTKFMSLSFSEPREKRAPAEAGYDATASADEPLPF